VGIHERTAHPEVKKIPVNEKILFSFVYVVIFF
jgi:hypothetical protein